MSTDAAHRGWGRQAGPGPFWDGRGPGKAANASGGTNSHEHMPCGGLEAASALGRQGTWQRSQESPGTDVRPPTSFVLGAAAVNAPGRWDRATLRDPLSLRRPEDTSSSSWPRASLGFWPRHPRLCIGHLLCSSSYEAPGHVDRDAPQRPRLLSLTSAMTPLPIHPGDRCWGSLAHILPGDTVQSPAAAVPATTGTLCGAPRAAPG